MAPLTRRSTRDRSLHPRATLAAVAVGALLLASIASVDAATVTVASVNFRFEPETRTVNVGDVVRWTFAGDPHTVTSGSPGSPDGRFDSGVKDAGGSFQVTFSSAGTFPYFCQIHPEQMFGTIVVQAGPAATPKPTAKPTPKPTSRPTPRPTTEPTAAPTAAPTEAPTEAPATQGPTSAPSPSESPSSALPTASPSAATPSASASPSAVASASPEASPSPDPSDAASGLDPVAIIALGLVVGLLVAGGVALLRRSPRG